VSEESLIGKVIIQRKSTPLQGLTKNIFLLLSPDVGPITLTVEMAGEVMLVEVVVVETS